MSNDVAEVINRALLGKIRDIEKIGNRVDFEEGGPEKTIGYLMNLIKPEAAYIKAGTRTSLIVADLDEEKMTELMLVASKQLGTYPTFIPVIPVADIPEMVGKLLNEMKKAP